MIAKLEVLVSFLDEVQWKPGEQAESDAEMKKPYLQAFQFKKADSNDSED